MNKKNFITDLKRETEATNIKKKQEKIAKQVVIHWENCIQQQTKLETCQELIKLNQLINQ